MNEVQRKRRRQKYRRIRDDKGHMHSPASVYIAIVGARSVSHQPKQLANYLSTKHGIHLTPYRIGKIARDLDAHSTPILWDIARGFGTMHLNTIMEKHTLKSMAVEALQKCTKDADKRAWIATIRDLQNDLTQLYDLTRVIMEHGAAGDDDHAPVIPSGLSSI
ncbi:MAG: hypothetical protein K8823_1517 [Cenarchaeum symbiont of Oopsacas minuta]|nr:hypothetical protein [Cenarchaeum symbiont of Oopsacas minuta]